MTSVKRVESVTLKVAAVEFLQQTDNPMESYFRRR